jgi:hypothetical protein
MNASEKGHTATVQALIGAGANPNQHTEVSDCCCSYKGCVVCEQNVVTVSLLVFV